MLRGKSEAEKAYKVSEKRVGIIAGVARKGPTEMVIFCLWKDSKEKRKQAVLHVTST